jgi:hypothetical protein
MRLLGALQYLNPNLQLWYRGESNYYPTARSSRYRAETETDPTPRAIDWFNKHAGEDRGLRDRGPMERAAILQHYGVPTSLLDITSSIAVACAFAFENRNVPYLRIFATPRHTQATTNFVELPVVLVDLRAALPSYWLRPHVQEAAFIARREALSQEIAGEPRLAEKDASLDDLCVGHIRLTFDGSRTFFRPRLDARTLYPPATRACKLCGTPDLNGDHGLHFLRCLVKKYGSGAPSNFPDNFAERHEKRRGEGS